MTTETKTGNGMQGVVAQGDVLIDVKNLRVYFPVTSGIIFQRKVADGTEAARSFAETAGMGLMGAGGLIAIAGGLLFLVVVADAMRARALQGARGPRSGARQSV